MKIRQSILITTVALLLSISTVSARAAPLGFRGWGPRFGLTVNPDQVHFGVHADLGDLTNRLRFQPNFELGVGDHATVSAFNLEVNYRFRDNWGAWSPYLGGGVGVLFTDYNRDRWPGRSDTESGASILGGIEKGISSRDRLFLEAKVGLTETPDLKLTIGWTFGY